MDKIQTGPEGIGEILMKNKSKKKAPAYKWQDLALKIINELNVPPQKKNSVFKVAKDYPYQFVEKALIDTRELCDSGERWRYFFKVIADTGLKEKD